MSEEAKALGEMSEIEALRREVARLNDHRIMAVNASTPR